MGASCRMFHEEPLAAPMCFPSVESSNCRPSDEGSRDPALNHGLGRGSRLGARVGNPTNGTCVSSSGADREADVGSGPCAIPPP
jgi:hypothetical protein